MEDKHLKILSVTDGECSELSKGNGAICSTVKIQKALVSFTNKSNPLQAIKSAKDKTGCKTEKCVLTDYNFKRHAKSEGINNSELKVNEVVRFKPEGPRDKIGWLTNSDIDGVLHEWCAANKDLYNWEYNMIDFDKYGGTLSRYSMCNVLDGNAPLNLGRFGGIVKRPCKIAASVINTDCRSGKGKHWFAVLCDCRNPTWSVEFFNSSGNPPVFEIIEWMERTTSELKKRNPDTIILQNTGRRHQYKRTECGLYSLYFIRRRLEGHPFTDFLVNQFDDDTMTKFRKYCFNATERS